MAVGNLLQKCDLAIAAYLISEGAGTAQDVFPNKRSEDKDLPCTIIESKHAKRIGNAASNTWEVTCSVYIRTKGLSEEDGENQSGLPAESSGDRVALTVDAFNTNLDQSGETLADLINTAATSVAAFSMQCVETTELHAGFEAKGDSWCDIIELEIICSPGSNI